MSTRDEILAALTEATAGLTSKELAPLCPAADCDPMIVGRVVALLRSENVIHPGDELRAGGTIWLFGGEKVEEVVEHVGLHDFNRRHQSDHISEAARAISDMRRPPSTARRAPDRAQPPVTTPAPAGVVETAEEARMDPYARVLNIITKAGDAGLPRSEIAKVAGNVTKMKRVLRALLAEKSITRTGATKSVRYFATGAPRPSEPLPRRVPPKKVNGSSHDAYAAALTSLQEKRAVLADELAKIDRAIEAVGALA